MSDVKFTVTLTPIEGEAYVIALDLNNAFGSIVPDFPVRFFWSFEGIPSDPTGFPSQPDRCQKVHTTFTIDKNDKEKMMDWFKKFEFTLEERKVAIMSPSPGEIRPF